MCFRKRIVLAIAIGIFTGALLGAQSSKTKPSPADILPTFKTIYVQSKTPLAKPWGLSITSELDGADVVVEIDHQAGWFYYTYSMTHPSSGLVLAVGRVDTWDGKYASAKIAKEIMKHTAAVRDPPKEKK